MSRLRLRDRKQSRRSLERRANAAMHPWRSLPAHGGAVDQRASASSVGVPLAV